MFFPLHFLEIVAEVQALQSASCVKAVAGGKQAHVPCGNICRKKCSLLWQSYFDLFVGLS